MKPAVLIILADTNDIARNTGPETAAMIQENFQAMTELAQAHGIKVILCSLTPVSDYTKTRQTVSRPPANILKLNAWLRDYAAQVHAGFDKGMLRDGYSGDGLHPNDKGYERLAPIAQSAIDQSLLLSNSPGF